MPIMLPLLCLFLASGCTSLSGVSGVPAPMADEPARRALAALVQFADAVEAGQAPDPANVRRVVGAAQLAALQSAARLAAGGLDRAASDAALGVALTLCRDGISRLEQLPADPAAETRAAAVARLRLACIAPLAALAG